MRQLIMQVWLLLLSAAILMASRGLGSSFIGVRAEIENFSISWIGFIQGCSFIGFLISGIYVPKILRNIGHIRVFASCATIMSIIPLIQLLLINPYFWAITQIFFGIGIAGSYIVIEAWLNEASDNSNRGKLFGLYSLISMSITSAIPLIIGPVSPNGIALFLLISIFSSLAFIPVALGAKWTPTYAETETMQLKTLYKRSPYGIISYLFSLIVITTFFVMYLVYVIKLGFELSVGTKSFLIMGICSSFTIYLLGILSDKTDRRYIIVFTSFASFVFLYIMNFSAESKNELWFLLSSIGFGTFMYPLYPLIVCHINDRLKTSEILSASSWLILIAALTGIIGTISIGPIIELFGISSFPYLMMFCMAVNVLYGLYRLTQRKGVESEQQVDFVALSSLSGSVLDQEIFSEQKIIKKKKKFKKQKKKNLRKAKKRLIKRR